MDDDRATDVSSLPILGPMPPMIGVSYRWAVRFRAEPGVITVEAIGRASTRATVLPLSTTFGLARSDSLGEARLAPVIFIRLNLWRRIWLRIRQSLRAAIDRLTKWKEFF